MAKRSKDQADVALFGFATVDENGKAPDCRVTNANDAWIICDNLKRDNSGREHKWGNVYRCYKRFTPVEYSEVAKKQLEGLSNVNYGQMEFIIDSQKSSFYDMVTERNLASTIVTKEGNEKERKEWSELISIGFDMILRQWPSYLYNVEEDLEEMLIAGKGIELKEDKASWFTRSMHNSEVLIPDRTRANLDNLGEVCIKRSYTPLEFWKKIKDQDIAKQVGYNFWACVEAMRIFTVGQDDRNMTNTEYLRRVASGDLNLTRFYQRRIEIYELLVEEFDGSITKMAVLQNYMPLAGARKLSEEKYRNEAGFLFCKRNWVEKKEGWNSIIMPFTDSVGSGLWHEIKGLGERVFVACRQYDINMNKVIDALNLSGMLMLKGGSADATEKLKKMQWGQFQILPEDLEFAQNRFTMPIGEIISGMQFYMGDLYRGIANYRINEPSNKGGQRTKGEAELDASEDARLRGTQLRRYNQGHTGWQGQMYKGMSRCTSGSDGYDLKELFVEFMEKNKVPKDAWNYDNIESINSNMLSGAGSPSFKLMAATKLVELTSITASNPGQYQALRDAAAALGGRQNVDVYFPKVKVDMPDEVRVIALENVALSESTANPENAKVFPSDNHVEHIKGHFSDAMVMLDTAQKMIQSGQPDVPELKEIVGSMMLKGAHIMAHMQFVEKDPTKKDLFKKFQEALQSLQRRTDELIAIVEEMQKSQEGQQAQPKSEDDIKMEALVAKNSIELDALQKKMDLKLAEKALVTDQKIEAAKETAGVKLAIERAKSKSSKPVKKPKPAAAEE